MSDIIRTDTGFTVDAALIGGGLKIEPATVPELMRTGQITCRSETGQGSDAGRFRVTFFSSDRVLRLTLDAEGQLISRTAFDRQKGI